jgi:hypothetical protein
MMDVEKGLAIKGCANDTLTQVTGSDAITPSGPHIQNADFDTMESGGMLNTPERRRISAELKKAKRAELAAATVKLSNSGEDGNSGCNYQPLAIDPAN